MYSTDENSLKYILYYWILSVLYLFNNSILFLIWRKRLGWKLNLFEVIRERIWYKKKLTNRHIVVVVYMRSSIATESSHLCKRFGTSQYWWTSTAVTLLIWLIYLIIRMYFYIHKLQLLKMCLVAEETHASTSFF